MRRSLSLLRAPLRSEWQASAITNSNALRLSKHLPAYTSLRLLSTESTPPGTGKRRSAAATLAAFEQIEKEQAKDVAEGKEYTPISKEEVAAVRAAAREAEEYSERALYRDEQTDEQRENEELERSKPKQGEKRNKWKGRLIFLAVIGGTYGLLQLFYGDKLGNPLGLMLKYINENKECAWLMYVLMYIVERPENQIELIEQNGVQALLKRLMGEDGSLEGEVEDVRRVAMQIIYSMSGHPVPREYMGDRVKVLLPCFLELINDNDREVSQIAVQCLYYYLGDDWAKKILDEEKAFEQFVKLGQSKDPEKAQLATQLIAGYCMENPTFLATRKLSKAELEVTFNAVATYGSMYQEQGHYKFAARCHEQTLLIDATNPIILCQMGKAYKHLNEKTKSQQALRKSLAANPGQCETAYTLASSLLSDDNGLSTVRTCAGLLAGGVEELRLPPSQAVQQQFGGIHPIASPAFSLLVDCLQKLGDIDGATDAASEWVLLKHSDAKSHAALGRLLVASAEYEEALSELMIASKLDPTNGGTYYQTALALHKLGKNKEAMLMCTRATRIAEARHRHKIALEVRNRKGGKTAENGGKTADGDVKPKPKPTASLPKHIVPAYKLLGLLAKKENDNEMALQAYDKLSKVLPLSSARAQAHYQKGAILDTLREGQAASAAYTDALADWTQVATTKRAQAKAKGAKSPTKSAILGKRELEAVAKLARRCRTIKAAQDANLVTMCDAQKEFSVLLG